MHKSLECMRECCQVTLWTALFSTGQLTAKTLHVIASRRAISSPLLVDFFEIYDVECTLPVPFLLTFLSGLLLCSTVSIPHSTPTPKMDRQTPLQLLTAPAPITKLPEQRV